MASLYFTRINGEALDTPIEFKMPTIPSRLLTGKYIDIDYEQAVNLGFKEGTPFLTLPSESHVLSPSNRYYMENGNFLTLTDAYENGGGYFTWNWGYDFDPMNAGDTFSYAKWGTSQNITSVTTSVEVYFYAGLTGAYSITVITLSIPSPSYPSRKHVIINPYVPTHSTGSTTYENLPVEKYTRQFFFGDPKFEGDINSVAGGLGNYDNSSDSVDLPPLPTLSPLDCGMFSLYAPTSAQLKRFSEYLWSNNVFENLPKLFQDPMQAILNLAIIPVNFPLSNSKSIVLGTLDTGVVSSTVTQQFFEIDFGTLNLSEFWGNFCDYDNTRVEIYLPFIGTQSISTKDVMSCDINLKYRIDLLTGTCCAYLTIKRENMRSVLYQWNGNCSINIPLTAQNVSQKISGLINIGISTIAGASTGLPLSSLALSAGSNLLSAPQTNIQKSGSFQMETAYMGVWKPYIIVTRPKQAYPEKYPEFKGYPSNITSTISSVSGYTEIESIHLENVSASNEELIELENILKSGFIV